PSAGRFGRLTSHRWLLGEDALPVVPQSLEPGPGSSAVPLRSGRPFTGSPHSPIDANGRAYRRLRTPSNDLWAARVEEEEPMAQLHERAMPIGKFFVSAERLGARAQGVVRVNERRQTVTSVDPIAPGKLGRGGRDGADTPKLLTGTLRV